MGGSVCTRGSDARWGPSRWLLGAGLALLIVLGAGTARARAAEGQPDTSFASGGTFSHQFGFGSFQPLSLAFATAEQSNGDLVLAGESGDGGGEFDLLVVRLTPSGALDPSFGAGGEVDLNLGPQHDTAALAVAVQSDGRIVVGANTYNGSQEATVVRLLSNGALDGSFGSGGVAQVENLTASGLALAPGGDIALAGTWRGTTPGALALAELTPAGAPAAGFGSGGLVIDQLSPSDGSAGEGIAIDSAGRIYATAVTNGAGRLLRFSPSGSADASFGTGGSVALASDGEALALAADGTPLVAGSLETSTGAHVLSVQHLLASGQPDTGFGSGGQALLQGSVGGGSDERADSVAVRPDGEILAASSANPYGLGPSSVWLLKTAGTLDPAFGSAGRVDLPGDRTGIGSERDDSAVVAGGVPFGQQIIFTVTRLLGPSVATPGGGGSPGSGGPAPGAGSPSAPPLLSRLHVSCRARRVSAGQEGVLCQVRFTARSRTRVTVSLSTGQRRRATTRTVKRGRHTIAVALTPRGSGSRAVHVRVSVRAGSARHRFLNRALTVRLRSR